MDWKKFTGPAILFALALLFYVVANVSVDVKYEEGETVESEIVFRFVVHT